MGSCEQAVMISVLGGRAMRGVAMRGVGVPLRTHMHFSHVYIHMCTHSHTQTHTVLSSVHTTIISSLLGGAILLFLGPVRCSEHDEDFRGLPF